MIGAKNDVHVLRGSGGERNVKADGKKCDKLKKCQNNQDEAT